MRKYFKSFNNRKCGFFLEKCLELYDGLILQKIDIDMKIILKLHMLLLKAIPSYEGYAGVWRPVKV